MDRLQPLAGETRRDSQSCFVFLEKKKKEKETIAQIIPENKMKSYQRIDPSTRNDSSRPFFPFFFRIAVPLERRLNETIVLNLSQDIFGGEKRFGSVENRALKGNTWPIV